MNKEYDGADLAWQLYKARYRDNLKIERLENKNKNNTDRLYVEEYFKHGEKKSYKMIFSGDIDFNFSRKGLNGQSRYDIFKKLLKNNKECIERLDDYMKNKHHSEENISIMPSTGNLQNVKQGIGNDRLDTFVWALNEYYNNNSNLLFNHSTKENMPALSSFLELFIDIYDYCKTIYHIEEELVDDLIKSGSKAIDSEERVKRYMDLADRFWKSKKKAYKNFFNE